MRLIDLLIIVTCLIAATSFPQIKSEAAVLKVYDFFLSASTLHVHKHVRNVDNWKPEYAGRRKKSAKLRSCSACTFLWRITSLLHTWDHFSGQEFVIWTGTFRTFVLCVPTLVPLGHFSNLLINSSIFLRHSAGHFQTQTHNRSLLPGNSCTGTPIYLMPIKNTCWLMLCVLQTFEHVRENKENAAAKANKP